MKKVFNEISKYFKGVRKEVSRIRWTNSKDLVKYSIATVSFMIFFGIFFYGVDVLISVVRSML